MRMSRVSASASSAALRAGSITETLTVSGARSGRDATLNVRTASPAEAPLIVKVAMPATGVAESAITTSALLDSTVTTSVPVSAR